MVLAVLSAAQSFAWESPSALWLQARDIAPHVPRPWINLASHAMDQREDAIGEDALREAIVRASNRPASEQTWTMDLANANLALIRRRQGRLADAQALVRNAPYESARWQVCQVICGS